MIQLESFGSIVPPDPDLNRVYTHGLALDSTYRKTLMVVPFALPRLVQNIASANRPSPQLIQPSRVRARAELRSAASYFLKVTCQS